MNEPAATEQLDRSTLVVGELTVEVDSEREVLDAELLAEKQALEQQSLDVDAKLAENTHDEHVGEITTHASEQQFNKTMGFLIGELGFFGLST